MVRCRLILIAMCAVALTVSYSVGQSDEDPLGNVVALQKQRIELLEQRVANVRELHEEELVDRTELIETQIDLLNAQLSYAGSNQEKRAKLASLMKSYDELVEIAELELGAPRPPVASGTHARTPWNQCDAKPSATQIRTVTC